MLSNYGGYFGEWLSFMEALGVNIVVKEGLGDIKALFVVVGNEGHIFLNGDKTVKEIVEGLRKDQQLPVA